MLLSALHIFTFQLLVYLGMIAAGFAIGRAVRWATNATATWPLRLAAMAAAFFSVVGGMTLGFYLKQEGGGSFNLKGNFSSALYFSLMVPLIQILSLLEGQFQSLRFLFPLALCLQQAWRNSGPVSLKIHGRSAIR